MDIEISYLKNLIVHRNNKNIKKNKKKDEKEFNIINKYDFFCENNIKTNELIEKIQNSKDYFILIDEIESIKIRDIDNYNDIELIGETDKYVLIKYNLNNFSYFIDFFKSLPNPRLFIYHIIDSYNHILEGLNILFNNNIYLFDLTNRNIIFDNTLKPKIINYELALHSDIKKCNFIDILKKCNNYTLKPIELHLLFYIYNNNIEYISSSFISEIIDTFVKNMPFFELFSLKYKEQYKKESLHFFNSFINKPKDYIYDEIIRYKYTWSNYSLSIIYLYIVGNVIKNLNIKNTIINKILLILNKNINPNPNKREKINETINKMDILFGEYNNWDFIKSFNDVDLKYQNLINNL